MSSPNSREFGVFSCRKMTTVTVRAFTKSEPTIDLCMKKWGQTTLIDSKNSRKWGSIDLPDLVFLRSINTVIFVVNNTTLTKLRIKH